MRCFFFETRALTLFWRSWAMVGLPLLVCCCCRVRSECASEPASPCRRGAPLSHCRVGSAGCVGIWQLCDAARTVGCRSRFVLVAQQANSYSKCRAPTPHDVERRRGLSHASEESSHGRLARGRMTAFLSPSGNWQHGRMAHKRGAISPSLPHRCGKSMLRKSMP